MSKGHTHKCDRCGEPYGCCGDWIRNFDGWPDPYCDIYHQYPKGHAFRLCEDCAVSQPQEKSA